MKFIVAITTLIIASMAHAEAVKVASFSFKEYGRITPYTQFVINKNWEARIDLIYDIGTDSIPTTHRVAVPGLRFDESVPGIVFDGQDGTVICANALEKNRALSRRTKTVIVTTGRCNILTGEKVIRNDKGRIDRRKSQIEIFLSIE